MRRKIKTREDGGGSVIFYGVDSSYHHMLYLDFEKASLMCFIINHL